jgi:hypothetical protein
MGPRARCSTVLSPCRCPFFRWVAPVGHLLPAPRVFAGSLWACRDWGLLRDRSVHGRFEVVGWSPSGQVPSHRWRGWGDGGRRGGARQGCRLLLGLSSEPFVGEALERCGCVSVHESARWPAGLFWCQQGGGCSSRGPVGVENEGCSCLTPLIKFWGFGNR